MTDLHAHEQRRRESEARKLAADYEKDSCHTRLDYERVRTGESGLWKVAYPGLAHDIRSLFDQWNDTGDITYSTGGGETDGSVV
jgi:hypothetical protein